MRRSFDDLFNEFFGNRKNNISSINEEIRKIIDSLMNYKKLENDIANSIQDELGEADEIIDHIRNGLKFRKLIWNTPYGQFVKIIVTDLNTEDEPVKIKKETKSLEDQLKEAVEAENYELAIELRDKINKNKRTKGRKKKTE